MRTVDTALEVDRWVNAGRIVSIHTCMDMLLHV